MKYVFNPFSGKLDAVVGTTASLDARYVNITGDTMTGDLEMDDNVVGFNSTDNLAQIEGVAFSGTGLDVTTGPLLVTGKLVIDAGNLTSTSGLELYGDFSGMYGFSIYDTSTPATPTTLVRMGRGTSTTTGYIWLLTNPSYGNVDCHWIPMSNNGYDLGSTGRRWKKGWLVDIDVSGAALFSDKIKFTQTDGNEYIDSLADGYMDYGATTGHRFDADIFLGSDSRKIAFGTDGASDSYIHYDGGELDILSATDINLEPNANLQINGVSGWTGTFTNGDGATVTVAKGIITGVA